MRITILIKLIFQSIIDRKQEPTMAEPSLNELLLDELSDVDFTGMKYSALIEQFRKQSSTNRYPIIRKYNWICQCKDKLELGLCQMEYVTLSPDHYRFLSDLGSNLTEETSYKSYLDSTEDDIENIKRLFQFLYVIPNRLKFREYKLIVYKADNCLDITSIFDEQRKGYIFELSFEGYTGKAAECPKHQNTKTAKSY